MKEFVYKDLTVKYDERDNVEQLKELLDEMIAEHYEDFEHAEEIDFSDFDPNYFYIDGKKYQHEDGKLLSVEDEEDASYDGYEGDDFIEEVFVDWPVEDAVDEVGSKDVDKVVEYYIDLSKEANVRLSSRQKEYLKDKIEKEIENIEYRKSLYSYDDAISYIEEQGVSCDPAGSSEGEYVCDLLDDDVDYKDGWDTYYEQSTLDYIIERAKEYLEEIKEEEEEED